MQQSRLTPYIRLVRQFTQGQMSAAAFERSYLRLFKQDATHWPEDVFSVLNELFLDVDAFCGDSDLRDAQNIGEIELRARSTSALAKLETMSETADVPLSMDPQEDPLLNYIGGVTQLL